MSSQLPSQTKILIVGAGPSGLATAVSLRKHGVSAEDILIVDSALHGESDASRAIIIHSATLEALDSIGCADELVSLGIRMKGIHIRDRNASPIYTNDFSPLEGHTKYPFALTLSQTYTEKRLIERLGEISIQVSRPHRVVGIKASDSEYGLEVSFEDGQIVKAQYVIGADGPRSVIRQVCGIGFSDPKHTQEASTKLAQFVLADVTFNQNIDHLFPTDPFGIWFGLSPSGFFLTAPLGHPKVNSELYGTQDPVYRLAFSVSGEAPSRPGLEIIQKWVDQRGPFSISSDSSVNPHAVQIKTIHWSSRFRSHSAIADTFFKRVRGTNENENGGVVMLVGDAAHIHSPAGGQGMNLGIRDAVGLGSVLAKHIETSNHLDINLELLQDFAQDRHSRALKQIEMTKTLLWLMAILMNPSSIQYWAVYLVGMLPFLKRRLVWQLSGLENR